MAGDAIGGAGEGLATRDRIGIRWRAHDQRRRSCRGIRAIECEVRHRTDDKEEHHQDQKAFHATSPFPTTTPATCLSASADSTSDVRVTGSSVRRTLVAAKMAFASAGAAMA